MATERLRKCSSCSKPFSPGDLGLRDYLWINEFLPGKVGGTDIDFLLERNGDFLALELKPRGVPLPRGQQITFEQLRKKGFEVWVIEGDKPGINDEDEVRVHWNGSGAYADMKVRTLRGIILNWYEARSVVMRKPNREEEH